MASLTSSVEKPALVLCPRTDCRQVFDLTMAKQNDAGTRLQVRDNYDSWGADSGAAAMHHYCLVSR